MKFKPLVVTAEKFVGDNSPSILTGIAVAGTITTAVLAGKASWEACRYVESEATQEELDFLDFKLRFKLVWKLYIPAATTGVVTIAAIVSANHIGNRRAAAVAAAYSITDRAFAEYKDKVAETLGERKEEKIRDAIAQDRVSKSPPDTQLLITGEGTVVVQEGFTGRYFASSIEAIRKAQNDTNAQINSHFYASLSDFYDFVGWPRTAYSDDVGWNSDKPLDVRFSGVLDDGKPCVYMEYTVVPIRNYYKTN